MTSNQNRVRLYVRGVNPAPFLQAAALPNRLQNSQTLEISANERSEKMYNFVNFPIKMDDTVFNIMGRYSVALLHYMRFSMIYVRIKWRNANEPPFCAMLQFGISDDEIRKAVEECAGELEHFYRVQCAGRYPVSRSSEKYLNSHYVVIMDKVSENFPDAIYWCSLCDFHMTSIQHVRTHFEAHQHFSEEQRISERKSLMEKLPRMSVNHLKAINLLIEQLLDNNNENGRVPLWQQRLELSKSINELFTRFVFEKMEVEGHTSLYGSVLSRTCIESSDLNVTIDIPSVDSSDAVETMKRIAELINVASGRSDCGFELDAQFLSDVPMCIKIVISSVCIRATWRFENGLKFGKLLAVYTTVRPQFAELCRVVRKWAQMRPLMFHERKSRPTIDDYFESRELYESDVDVILEKFGSSDEAWDLGHLFVEFLGFYGSRFHQNEVVQVYTAGVVTKDRTRWGRKLLQIADPFRTDNVVTFTKSFQAYFYNCFLKSYLYFVIPQTSEGPLLDVTLYQKIGERSRKKRSKRRKGVAQQKTTKDAEVEQSVVTEIPNEVINSTEHALALNPSKNIEDAEFTAAADFMAEENDMAEKLRRQIVEDLMTTPRVEAVDERSSNGCQKKIKKNRKRRKRAPRFPSNLFLNVAYISRLDLSSKKSREFMNKLITFIEAATASNHAITGCSLINIPDRLNLPFVSPSGDRFFICRKSSCGFFVSRYWVKQVTEVVNLEKGLSEISLRIGGGCLLKLILCVEVHKSCTIGRLHQRLLDLKSTLRTCIIVCVDVAASSEAIKQDITKMLKTMGLIVWEGDGDKFGKSQVITATYAECTIIEGIEIFEEIIEFYHLSEKVRRVCVQIGNFEALRKRGGINVVDVESTKDEVNDGDEQAKRGKRKKFGKQKSAWKCHLESEREQVASVVHRLVEETVRYEQLFDCSRSLSGDINNEPSFKDVRMRRSAERFVLESPQAEEVMRQLSLGGTTAMGGENKYSAIIHKGTVEDSHRCNEDKTLINQPMYVKATSDHNFGEFSSYLGDVRIVVESLVLKSSLSEDEVKVEDEEKRSLCCENATAAVQNILLKDLTPENVEIDDHKIYSRRTMYRVRSLNPVRIDRHVYEILDRFGLASRDHKFRDTEVDEALQFRREIVNHERMRAQIRAKIVELEEDIEEVENMQLSDMEPGKECAIESVEHAASAEVQDNVCGPMKRVCYEDFFITVKNFDRLSFIQKANELDVDGFKYSFDDTQNFNNGYKPDIVCRFCESSEHLSDVCPQIKIPELENFTHQKELYEWRELDHVIMGGYEKYRIKPESVKTIREYVDRMRMQLQNELKKPIRLHIFGSLVSGFGVSHSDVDICFRFQSDEQPLDVDGVEIVRSIAQHLQQMKGVDKVYAITGAKVPIVKFMWTKLGIEGDISYYNVLALSNTELLKTYCAWDDRVAPLGAWIKRWAKSCDIGDASRGSLSSYAFIIMLISYLQNCHPPVLPRLQEDFREIDGYHPVLVENCDVYFHTGVVKGWSQNRLSISELFVGFLDYYAHFDFDLQVVQIRRKKPLLKVEKNWHRNLCIEDPFDLRHNLGSGVTRRMFVFIVRNIHNSRKRFTLSEDRAAFMESSGFAVDHEVPHDALEAYGKRLLTLCQMGAAPTDRQCRLCHRVGHFAESCPRRNSVRLWNRGYVCSGAMSREMEGTSRSNSSIMMMCRFRSGQRPSCRDNFAPRRTIENNDTSAPTSKGQLFGSRTNAVVGRRVFYRKGERQRGMNLMQ